MGGEGENVAPGGSSERTGESDPFQRAYRAYLTAVQHAWAEVDIDSVVNSPAGMALASNCYGTMGSFGTLGSAGGCLGSFGTAGTAGTLALQQTLATAGSVGTNAFSPASYGTAVESFATVGTLASVGSAGRAR